MAIVSYFLALLGAFFVASVSYAQNPESPPPPWHAEQVEVIAFSPRGSRYVVGTVDGVVAIRDRATHKRICSHRCCEVGYPGCISFTPDERRITVASGWTGLVIEMPDGKIYRSTPEIHERLRKEGITCTWNMYTPAGSLSTVTTIDTKTWKRGELTEGFAVSALSNSSDGRSVLRALHGSRPHVFLDENDQPPPRRCQKPYSIYNAQFSADGRFLSTEERGERHGVNIQLYEVSSGKVCTEFRVPMRAIVSVTLAPEGRVAAVRSHNDKVQVFDFFTRKIRSIPNKFGVLSRTNWFTPPTIFSPDAKYLAVALPDNSVQIADPLTGKELALLRCFNSPVTALAFSPDGRTLAAGLQNGDVLLLDLSSYLPRINSAAPQTAISPAEAADNLASSRQLRQWWTDLASDDAARAYRALWHLTSHPQQSLPFLATQMRSETNPIFERLPQLLGDLDDDAFRTRERASMQLQKVASQVEPILRQALLELPSPEARVRLRQLLDGLDVVPAGIALRDSRAVAVLERIGGPEAVKILRKLAQGASAASLTWEAKAALHRLSTRTASAKRR